MDLIGSWVTILSSTVWVREVNNQTIPAPTNNFTFPTTNFNFNNSRRAPRSVARSDLPWRK